MPDSQVGELAIVSHNILYHRGQEKGAMSLHSASSFLSSSLPLAAATIAHLSMTHQVLGTPVTLRKLRLILSICSEATSSQRYTLTSMSNEMRRIVVYIRESIRHMCVLDYHNLISHESPMAIGYLGDSESLSPWCV